jgi:hypothetical protein
MQDNIMKQLKKEAYKEWRGEEHGYLSASTNSDRVHKKDEYVGMGEDQENDDNRDEDEYDDKYKNGDDTYRPPHGNPNDKPEAPAGDEVFDEDAGGDIEESSEEEEELKQKTIHSFDERFVKIFADLVHYQDTHDDCHIVRKYITAEGYKLGNWVHEQRKKYKSGNLSDERIEFFHPYIMYAQCSLMLLVPN